MTPVSMVLAGASAREFSQSMLAWTPNCVVSAMVEGVSVLVPTARTLYFLEETPKAAYYGLSWLNHTPSAYARCTHNTSLVSLCVVLSICCIVWFEFCCAADGQVSIWDSGMMACRLKWSPTCADLHSY